MRTVARLTLVLLVATLAWTVAASVHAADPIKIGIVYPMSGSQALPVEGLIRGHKLAADEIMKSGGLLGRQIEFILRDDAGNPELTTRFTRELVMRNNVDWVFTGFGSAVALAGTAVARELKTPTFIFGGKTEKVTTEDWNPYVFRYQVTSTAEARAAAAVVANEILKGKKAPKVFWISWDYEYGHSLHGPFMARVKELIPDVKIVGEAWPRTGETDYGPFINHMLAVQPDVVVNAIWGGGVVSLLKQGTAVGLWNKSAFIGLAELAGVEYRTAIGKDMPAGAWGNTYDDAIWPNNDGQKKFYETYHNYTGQATPATGFASSGYYVTQLVAAGIRKAGTTKPEAVVKAMEGLTIDTYWGRMSIRDFDHQVTSGQLWAPMLPTDAAPFTVLDAKRARFVWSTPDLFSKDEWLAKRKAVGK
jgi:branched-chain amino acid transport system substrate-binding protein